MTNTRTKTFVALIALAALVTLVGVAGSSAPANLDEFEAAVFFSVAALVAHGLAYKLPHGGFGDIAFIPLLSGVAVAPSFPLVLGAGTAILFAAYFRQREPIRVFFNSAQSTLSIGLAVLVYRAASGEPLTPAGFTSYAPFVAGYATFFFCNAVCFAGVVSFSSRERFVSVLARAAGGASVLYDLIGIPIVLGFAYAYVRFGWGWSGALLLPLAVLRQVYKTNRELQTVNEELLLVMVAAIEARDPYTSGHSRRVATYSRVVAWTAGFGPRVAERVYRAALLHDVGKIHEGFASILRKTGRLSESEVAIMKTHSAKGAALVGKVTQFEDLVPAVLAHHEAWDGSGYPEGLQGDRIPLLARVIAIADTIDAMTSDRPYREALTPEAVREELSHQAGRQFDPSLAHALVSDKYWMEMANAIRSEKAQDPRLPSETAPITRRWYVPFPVANQVMTRWRTVTRRPAALTPC